MVSPLHELPIPDDLAAEILIEGIEEAGPVAVAVVVEPAGGDGVAGGVVGASREEPLQLVEVAGGHLLHLPIPRPYTGEVETMEDTRPLLGSCCCCCFTG